MIAEDRAVITALDELLHQHVHIGVAVLSESLLEVAGVIGIDRAGNIAEMHFKDLAAANKFVDIRQEVVAEQQAAFGPAAGAELHAQIRAVIGEIERFAIIISGNNQAANALKVRNRRIVRMECHADIILFAGRQNGIKEIFEGIPHFLAGVNALTLVREIQNFLHVRSTGIRAMDHFRRGLGTGDAERLPGDRAGVDIQLAEELHEVFKALDLFIAVFERKVDRGIFLKLAIGCQQNFKTTFFEVTQALDDWSRCFIGQLIVLQRKLNGVDAHLLVHLELVIGCAGADAVRNELRHSQRAGLRGAQRHGGEDGLSEQTGGFLLREHERILLGAERNVGGLIDDLFGSGGFFSKRGAGTQSQSSGKNESKLFLHGNFSF